MQTVQKGQGKQDDGKKGRRREEKASPEESNTSANKKQLNGKYKTNCGIPMVANPESVSESEGIPTFFATTGHLRMRARNLIGLSFFFVWCHLAGKLTEKLKCLCQGYFGGGTGDGYLPNKKDRPNTTGHAHSTLNKVY